MSATASLLSAFFILCAAGGVLALLIPARWSAVALAAIASLAALILLLASARLLIRDLPFHAALWTVLSLGTLTLAADRLSALFLFVTGLVFLPVSIFSGVYLKKYAASYSLRYFGILYHGLFASIALVLIADDAISFLIAWEAMSIISYLLVNFEHEHQESSHAGYVMLAMSEAGAIAVVIAFVLLADAAGTLEFDNLRSAAPTLTGEIRWAVFLLSFFGFAVKAGIVPVNSWLPLAHPVAPTNVSALLSSVIVNMGIIAAGIGAAMTFLAAGKPVVGAIALIAALYHLANHSLYKALLFIGTGAVEAGAGTRDLDRLGAIVRRMPWTSAFFLVGVLSISALPPFNGFVSEWLTLQTILRSEVLSSTAIKVVFAISGALLALTAGLAVTCFAKVYATGFLGMPRSEGAARAAETRMGTRAPLALLAASCALLGILPTYVIPVIDGVVAPLTHQSAVDALVPPFFNNGAPGRASLPAAFVAEFHDLGAQVGHDVLPGRGLVVLHRGGESNPVVFVMSTSYMIVALGGILALSFVIFRLLSHRRALTRGPVWAGGLRYLSPGMTYTATGFSNPVRVIFEAILHPAAGEDNVEAVSRHFRTAIVRNHTQAHIVDRLVLEPPVRALRQLANIAGKMHVGNVNAYAAYVLLTMLAVLVFGARAF